MSELAGPTKDQLAAQARQPSLKELFEQAMPGFGVQTLSAVALHRPKKLRDRHKIVLMLGAAGWRAKDIAAATGYTPARVSVILNTANHEARHFKDQFAIRVADNVSDVSLRFKLYANEMLDVLVSHARNKDDSSNSRLAAKDILHMAGYSPVKKEMHIGATVPVDELNKLLHSVQAANEVVTRSEWDVAEVKE
jgi:hypothetical protein